MIAEDYVSFETAKLLDEKGFDEKCFALYNPDGMLIQSGIRLNNTQVGRVEGSYSAPTLQMAMKWLREVHDLIIYVKLINDGDLYHDAWGFVVYNEFIEYIRSDKLWFKYEEAAEEAIKYCLENLI